MDATTTPPSPNRDPVTGGLLDTLSLEESLWKYREIKDEAWEEKPGRYYFSGTMSCFLKAWFKRKNQEAARKGLPPPYFDDPAHVFEPGNAEAGNAVEQRLIHVWKEVYGEHTVLKDVRFSKRLSTDTGEDIAFVGKSDPILIGDNFSILEFNEIKSALQLASRLKRAAEKYGRIVPLSAVGIDTPDEEGAANINNAAQLAVGVQWLNEKGMPPKKALLTYLWRGNYHDHLQIAFNPAEVSFLYGLAEWWVREHHEHLKSDTPPEPKFFMGYECRYCPFSKACADTKKERSIHPVMKGLNERLRAASVKG